MSGRGKHRGRGKGRPTSIVTKRFLAAQERGVHLKLPAHPPKFTMSPWQLVTTSIVTLGDQTISVSDINDNLCKDHGLVVSMPELSTLPTVQIRLHSFRAWCTGNRARTVVGNTPIKATVYSLFGGANDTTILADLEDYPAVNQYARVGYRWPTAQQEVVHEHNATSLAIGIDVPAADAQCLLYVDAWWRSIATADLIKPGDRSLVRKFPSSLYFPDQSPSAFDMISGDDFKN